jgi:flagellar motor switch protein FliM
MTRNNEKSGAGSVLTEQELNQLLTAVGSGPGEAAGKPAPKDQRKLKVYDFKRPERYSKDQMRSLVRVHENFARLASTILSSALGEKFQIHVASVGQLTYEEFIRSIPTPTAIGVIAMDPCTGSALLEIDPAIACAMIDCLFGGKGESLRLWRALTDMESTVISGVYQRLVECLREAWSGVADLRPGLTAIETSPDATCIAAGSDMTILVSCETKIAEVEGFINLCVPAFTIEPLAEELSAQYVRPDCRRSSGNVFVSTSSLPIASAVCYTGEEVPLSVLANLKRGSLIGVPRYGEGAALLLSGGTPLLKLAAHRARDARHVTYTVEEGSIESSARVPGPVEIKTPERATPVLLGEQTHRPLAPLSAEGRQPFGWLTIGQSSALAAFLGKEHPQLAALILFLVEPALAADILERMPRQMWGDIAARIAATPSARPEVLGEVDRMLVKCLAAVTPAASSGPSGMDAIVDILDAGTMSLESSVMDALEEDNPDIAEEIKKRRLLFEDIILLDRETIATIVKEALPEDMALALQGSTEGIRKEIWESLPAADAEALKARMESLGPTLLPNVVAAQQRIVGVIRRMEEEGRIVLVRTDHGIL